jgi:hypothetical protein
MPIQPSPINLQPQNEWTVLNIHNPVHTSNTPQTEAVTLLGQDVDIRAIPVTFTWDFGDGTSPLATTNPGREWTPQDGDPDESWVGHTYTHPGAYPITLTTTWHGQYRLAGDPTWSDLPGQATTTATHPGWQVLEFRTVLT